MDEEIQKLRAMLARRKRGRGKRYPASLKQRIGLAAKELRRRGQAWQNIGAFLGIPHETVRRFAGASRSGGFVPVQVVEPEPAVVMEHTRAGLVLLCPGGYRVEGLAVADAAELLRRLR